MRSDRNTVNDEYTVEGTVTKGASELLNYHNLSILQKIGDIDCPIHNVIYDYLDELISACVTLEFTDHEFTRYEYNPDLLSYDIYGTRSLDFIILALNEMASDKDFNKKKIKILESNKMEAIVNRIYMAEEDYIKKNRETYETE